MEPRRENDLQMKQLSQFPNQIDWEIWNWLWAGETPEMTSKWRQNDAKMTPKWRQNDTESNQLKYTR